MLGSMTDITDKELEIIHPRSLLKQITNSYSKYFENLVQLSILNSSFKIIYFSRWRRTGISILVGETGGKSLFTYA